MKKQNAPYTLIEALLTLLSISEDAAGDADYESLSYTQSQSSILPDFYKSQSIYGIKDFIDKMPGGFFIYRADGGEEFLYVNAAFIRIFQCSTLKEFRELTGNSFKGMVYHEDLDAVEQSILEQVAASQYDLDYVEYRIVRKDGMIRWIDDYGHFIHSDIFGDIFYVFAVDATEKKDRLAAERNALLNENAKRLEVIEGLSINYDTILYADLDLDKVLPYRLSFRAKHHFGRLFFMRDFKDCLTDYANTWVHPDDREMFLKVTRPEYMREKLSSSKTWYTNYRVLNGGETQYLQLRLVNVSKTDHVSQIVLGYRRVDEEIQQELEQKQVLEEALYNANLSMIARNTFLSNMSHDIRTPLNAISGFSALAKKQLGAMPMYPDIQDNAVKIAEYLDKIETAGQHLLNMIEKVLNLSSAESRENLISESKCSLPALMEEIMTDLLPFADSKKISLSLNTGMVNHTHVYSDREKLKQLILHLTDNAIKYTSNGGLVVLSVIETENPSDEYAVYQFVIEDNGIGISSDFINHIFDPFEREKNTTFSGIHGTGLGLTIARNISQMLGGNIDVCSTLGKGSKFTVTLSLRIRDASSIPVSPGTSSVPSSAPAVHPASVPRLLIAEDNEINLEIAREMLRECDFIIETAANGSIALEKLRNSSPGYYSLILMDIQMPVMDGRTAARAIRSLENPALAGIPIIALSADAFEADKQKSIECGMNAHLTKPINLPVLLETIRGLIGSFVQEQRDGCPDAPADRPCTPDADRSQKPG